ncbi:MAG TPA: glucose 1-dehydrogenase [Patescibacteria group bacterium]|nr:glucose 1-dehydrogenase [Patescibacteria group bacterium]
MSRLPGKVALITGGASGIGEGTVRLFAREGASVLIADIQDDQGARLAAELGARVAYVHTDVSHEADVQSAVAEAVRRFGRLDCIFNNAGFGGVGGRIEAIDIAGFDQTIGVLLRGVLLGMKHAAPVMKRQGGGSIISTASVAGLTAGFGPHVYSAAKAAVIQLTKTVAMELGEHNIRVNCICPGGIATPIFGKGLGMSAEQAEAIVPLMKGVLENLQPIKRSGVPDDIANAVLWLASDDATFVNGHALVVDGGLTGGRSWSESQFRRAALRQALGLPEE